MNPTLQPPAGPQRHWAPEALRRHARLRRRRARWRRLLGGLGQGFGQLFQALTSHWLVSLVGALAASLLVWFLGPLLVLGDFRPLETEAPRLGAVLGIMAAWGLFNQMRQNRERGADRRLAGALAFEPEAGGVPHARPLERPDPTPEVEGLQRRLAEALATYGRRLGQPSLRRLPWYLVIGAPGAGKTSAIAQSGLTFPLSDILGQRPIQGVAGTRTCDWWFTSEAVLVDTAGRYTTQDSEPAADRGAWQGLLDLLEQHRPAQPINGLVLVVSLGDLAVQGVVERQVLALSLNRRLAEIDARLGLRLPVYVLLTKADQLAGFSEFFADLSPEERRQVWGMTFDLPKAGPAVPAPAPAETTLAGLFNGHFERLLARLEPRMLERLGREPDLARRALIAGFPQQLAAMRPLLAEFLTQALNPPAPGRRLILRGVYLSSAKREGPLVDRLAAEVASTFGLAPRLPRTGPGPGRDFFLTQLFREVVFRESHLAGGGAGPLRPRRWAVPAILAVTLVLAALWGQAWLANHRLLADLQQNLSQAASLLPDELAGGPRLDRIDESSLAPVLPALAALRTVWAAAGDHAVATPWAIGLDQGERLVRLASGLYQRGLHRLLAPRLALRLEEVMAGPDGQSDGPASFDRTYDALKVYLMLTGAAPLDRYAVTQWFTIDWIASLPGADREGDRRQLALHLGALLEAGAPIAEAVPELVALARGRLAATPLTVRGETLLHELPAVRTLPGWHLLDQAGANAALVLARASGRSLLEPVPGLYTAEGARQTVLPAIAQIADDLAREGWVEGLPADDGAVAARARQLRQDLAVRYFDEYARQWLGVLGDLTVAPLGTLQSLQAALDAAAGPASPLPLLVAAVATETTLPRPAAEEAGADWWGAAATALSQRFAPLQTLARGLADPPRSPLAKVQEALADLRQALDRWESSRAADGSAAQVRKASERLKLLAAALPTPVSGWITGIAEAATRALLQGPGAPP